MTKAILVIDIPGEMCDDHNKWYLVSNDEIQLKYEEDGALMHYKDLGMDMELKPMPLKLDATEISIQLGKYEVDSRLVYQVAGYNRCIDEMMGEEE